MSVKDLVLGFLQGAAETDPAISIDASNVSDIRISGVDAFGEARLFLQATLNLSEGRSTLGQAMLATLWHIYNNGLIQYMGRRDPDGKAYEYNPEDFAQWVREQLSDDTANGDPSNETPETVDYAATLSYVVSRIFPEVHARAHSENPILVDGHPVTVERLLERKHMVSRLITISTAFEDALKEAKETEDDTMINNLITGALKAKSRDDLARQVRSMRDGAFEIDRLPYRVDSAEGRYHIEFRDLTAEQFALFEARFLSKHARRETLSEQEGIAQW